MNILQVNEIRGKEIQGQPVADYYQVITTGGQVIFDGISAKELALVMCGGLNQALAPVVASLVSANRMALDLLADIHQAKVAEIVEVRQALEAALDGLDRPGLVLVFNPSKGEQ